MPKYNSYFIFKADWILGMGDITGISVYCDSVKKQFVPRYVFCNTGISAISGNHCLFPLTA